MVGGKKKSKWQDYIYVFGLIRNIQTAFRMGTIYTINGIIPLTMGRNECPPTLL